MRRFALAAAALAGLCTNLASESISMTTTFPAPAVVYAQIVATGRSSAGAVDTTLGRNMGNVVLVPPSNAGGRVVVGAAATLAKLTVAGNVAVVDGTQGAGKVLTSDANGVARWDYPHFAGPQTPGPTPSGGSCTPIYFAVVGRGAMAACSSPSPRFAGDRPCRCTGCVPGSAFTCAGASCVCD